MTHRWLTRALAAVAAPALLVPALASSATAAPKPPAVPSIDAVAKIYPRLKGGSTDVTREKVVSAGKNCEEGKVVKGAKGRSATYMPAFEKYDDPDDTAKPKGEIVVVIAERFPAARTAHRYLRTGLADTKSCADAEGPFGAHAEFTSKRIRAKLGNERAGFQFTWTKKGSTATMNAMFVRQGKDVVTVVTVPIGETDAAPSIPKTVAVTRLALKTVR